MPLAAIFAFFVGLGIDPWRIYIYIYIIHYIPIGQSQTRIWPNVIIRYILYLICQKLYSTVSGQLSNIGYIGQFQNEATGTLRTR